MSFQGTAGRDQAFTRNATTPQSTEGPHAQNAVADDNQLSSASGSHCEAPDDIPSAEYLRARRRTASGDQIFAEPETLDGGIATRVEEAWATRIILSLDGGGIRGYWTLLALQQLMQDIEAVELNFVRSTEDDNVNGTPALHSFHPSNYPENVSHAERRHESDARREGDPDFGKLKSARRYLPCHYFDYIGGSSTGGLIATMLGRLRMPVLDAMVEYRTLGQKVFGKPRTFIALNFPFIKRTKYDSRKVRKVFEDVARRRGEVSLKTFASPRGMCKTFVTSLKSEPEQGTVRELYLIRSYRYTERKVTVNGTAPQGPRRRETFIPDEQGPTMVRRVTSNTHLSRRPINDGDANNFQIFEVAQAATAAPFYFDAVTIDAKVFEDGGMGTTSNPALEGLKEVEFGEGSENIGAVVSIGTARYRAVEQKDSFWLPHRIRSWFDQFANPAQVHGEMQRKAAEKKFKYYRFNPTLDDHLLKMELDAWQPKSKRGKKASGHVTIDQIVTTFNEWYASRGVAAQFVECATELVHRRRARTADQGRWERFATGVAFHCPVDGCPQRTIDNRDEWDRHLRSHKPGQLGPREELERYQSNWEYKPPRSTHKVR